MARDVEVICSDTGFSVLWITGRDGTVSEVVVAAALEECLNIFNDCSAGVRVGVQIRPVFVNNCAEL